MMQTTSEKALRKELQKHFNIDMAEKKAFIKEHVSALGGQGGRAGRGAEGIASLGCWSYL